MGGRLGNVRKGGGGGEDVLVEGFSEWVEVCGEAGRVDGAGGT